MASSKAPPTPFTDRPTTLRGPLLAPEDFDQDDAPTEPHTPQASAARKASGAHPAARQVDGRYSQASAARQASRPPRYTSGGMTRVSGEPRYTLACDRALRALEVARVELRSNADTRRDFAGTVEALIATIERERERAHG